MNDVTEADRVKAEEVVEKIAGVPWDVFTEAEWGWAGHIAEALADERVKARAPFLALADELVADDDFPGFEASPDYWAGLSEAADRIRRAAGDPT